MRRPPEAVKEGMERARAERDWRRFNARHVCACGVPGGCAIPGNSMTAHARARAETRETLARLRALREEEVRRLGL